MGISNLEFWTGLRIAPPQRSKHDETRRAPSSPPCSHRGLRQYFLDAIFLMSRHYYKPIGHAAEDSDRQAQAPAQAQATTKEGDIGRTKEQTHCEFECRQEGQGQAIRDPVTDWPKHSPALLCLVDPKFN